MFPVLNACSHANSHRVKYEDDAVQGPNNKLMVVYLLYMIYFKPKYFLLENVAGMLSLGGASMFRLVYKVGKVVGKS